MDEQITSTDRAKIAAFDAYYKAVRRCDEQRYYDKKYNYPQMADHAGLASWNRDWNALLRAKLSAQKGLMALTGECVCNNHTPLSACASCKCDMQLLATL